LKVVHFAQTHPGKASQICRSTANGGNVTIPKSDKHKDYTRYAEQCLKMVTLAKDRDSRAIQREMAAEWLKLADAIVRPLKPMK
jgi:hypothetical protein